MTARPSARMAGRPLLGVAALLALLALPACAKKIPVSQGPVFELNAGRWQPRPEDMRPPQPLGRTE